MKLNRLLALAGLALLGTCWQGIGSGSAIEEMVVDVGKEAAGELMRNLKTALTEAMKTGGPTAAIQVCKMEAPLLTENTSANFPEIKIRRTSLKFRSSANRPDALDQTVLAELARIKGDGDPLPEYRLRKISKEGEAAYRFYQPITLSGFCLNCHGSRENMSADVIKVLEREYPEDRAVDYRSGDLRGVISVEIPEHALAD
jgi:hypothetical protein